MSDPQGVRRVTPYRRTLRAALVPATLLALGVMAAGPALAQTTTTRVPDQVVDVSNGGGADANTGGNDSVGNGSTNGSEIGGEPTTVDGGLLGGLLGAGVNLGSTNNASGGTSNVSSGPANAAGNQTATGVGQNDSGTNQSFFGANGDGQAAFVGNSGDANANTGGNDSIGNGSTNAAGITQGGGGAVGAGVNLGSVNNVSDGTSNISTGAANALGNTSQNGVNQNLGGAGGGFGGLGGDCRSGTFDPNHRGQVAGVGNSGDADANTGNNRGTGNASRNGGAIIQNVGGDTTGTTAPPTSTPGVTLPILGGSIGDLLGGLLGDDLLSGGLVNAGVNLGSVNNTSNGTSNINTGPAGAVGNQAANSVNQNCGVRPVVLNHPGGVSGRHPGSPIHQIINKAGTVTRGGLALTGMSSGDLTALAAALMIAGVLLAGPARRRHIAHRLQVAAAAEVPRGWLPTTAAPAAPKAKRAKSSGDMWDDAVLAGPATSASPTDDRSARFEALV